jgi:plastocyanin
MRRTLLIAAITVLLLGAACKKVTTNTNSTPVNGSANSNDSGVLTTNTNSTSNANVDTTNATVLRAAIVTITASGLDPKSFSVPVGTTVTFQNQDSVSHEIASDPHPSHSDLPAFDSGTGIAPGESYSFTFTRVGSWGYHDHADPYNATFTGSVTVTST